MMITMSQHNNPKHTSGVFKYEDGKLDFTIENSNVTFEESREALLKVKEEIERLLGNQKQCPYHVRHEGPVVIGKIDLPKKEDSKESYDEGYEAGRNNFLTKSQPNILTPRTSWERGFKHGYNDAELEIQESVNDALTQ